MKDARSVSLLPVLVTLAAVMGGGPARAEEGTTAIFAAPVGSDVPGALAARFEAVLPAHLQRVGLRLMDPRLVDVKLAEHPEVMSGCKHDACVIAQARLLGVRRMLVPQMAKAAGGLRIDLTLVEVGPAEVRRVASVTGVCVACHTAALETMVADLSDRLGREVAPPVPEQTAAPAPAPLPAVPEPPPAPLRTGRRPLSIAKWVLGGVGVAALIAGSTLWALDGDATCAMAPGQLYCPMVLNTGTLGITLVAGGAASLAASALMFGLDRRGSSIKDGEPANVLSLAGSF